MRFRVLANKNTTQHGRGALSANIKKSRKKIVYKNVEIVIFIFF